MTLQRNNPGVVLAAHECAAGLPELCYTFHNTAPKGKRIIIVKRGEMGYYATDLDTNASVSNEDIKAVIREMNAEMGVTVAQEKAMYTGSLMGFDMPLADPRKWDDQGRVQ